MSRNNSAVNVHDVSGEIRMDMNIDEKHRKTAAFKSQSVVDRVTISTEQPFNSVIGVEKLDDSTIDAEDNFDDVIIKKSVIDAD